jgi:hypothetical protein
MSKPPPNPDTVFAKIAQAAARPWTRRSFITRAAGAAIFLLAAAKSSTRAQEVGCTPEPWLNECCCGNLSYDCILPPGGCCYGYYEDQLWGYFFNPQTQQCCGKNGPIPQQSSTGFPVLCCQYNCFYWIDPSGYPLWSCPSSQAYMPQGNGNGTVMQGCCNDGVYNVCTQGCCQGQKTYNLSTQCCCSDGSIQTCIPDKPIPLPTGC